MLRIYKTWLEQHVKSSYDQLRSRPWFAGGQPSRQGQRDKLSYAFLLWAAQTYDLLALEDSSVDLRDVLNDYQEVFMFAPNVGLENFFSLLKELLGWLRNEGTLRDLRPLAREYGSFLIMAVLRPVIKFLPDRYLDARSFRVLHHQFFFLSRITLETPGLEEKCAADWLAFECLLGTRPRVAELPHAPALRSIIRNWMTDCRISSYDPGYSSGSTADAGRLLCDKIARPYLTAELFHLIREIGYQTVNEVVVPQYEFVSKYTSVPKNALTRRTISMEPAYCNFWQTSVDRTVRSFIRSHNRPGQVGYYVDLNDQEKNRSLALASSKDRSMVTADLSAASDSITLDLVQYLFEGTPLLRWLLATRSTSTQILGIRVRLRKFAPMGSRLCFPVQSVIFAAIIFLAEAMVKIPLHERRGRAYGDDCIVETEAYEVFRELLREFGFKLNTDKSFDTSFFRESCGIFAYNGSDVTLPSFSRFGTNGFSQHLSYEEVGSLVTAANKAFVYGLSFTRYIYVECIRKHCEPLFVEPTIERFQMVLDSVYIPEGISRMSGGKPQAPDWGHFALLSWQPTNWRMRRRASKRNEADFGYGVARLPHRRPMADRGNRKTIPDRLRLSAWLYQAEYGEAMCIFTEAQQSILGPWSRNFTEPRTVPSTVESYGEVVMQWVGFTPAD